MLPKVSLRSSDKMNNYAFFSTVIFIIAFAIAICYTQPALTGSKPVSSKSNIFPLNFMECLHNFAKIIREIILVIVIDLQLPNLFLSYSLYNKIILAFFHSLWQNTIFTAIFINSKNIIANFSLFN
jgi:hypothetical protein